MEAISSLGVDRVREVKMLRRAERERQRQQSLTKYADQDWFST